MSIVIVPKHDDSTRRLIVLIGEWSIQKSDKNHTKITQKSHKNHTKVRQNQICREIALFCHN